MPSLGPVELIVLLLIVLVFVGPKKLPGLGKSLGTGLREFKDSVSSDKKDDGIQAELEEHKQSGMPTTEPKPSATVEPTPLTKEPTDAPPHPRDGAE